MRTSEPVNRLMMEKVLSIDVDAPAGEILRYFAEYPVHHSPVVDKHHVVVGMLSSADVLKLEAFLPKAGHPADYLKNRIRIDQIMRRPPITIGPHSAVEQAASLMANHGIHALPVVAESEGHLIGIITTTDIIAAALNSGRSTEPQRGSQLQNSQPQAHVSPEQMRRTLSLASNHASEDSEQGELSRALLFADSRGR